MKKINSIIIISLIILIGYLFRKKEGFELRYQMCVKEGQDLYCDLDKEKVMYPPPANVRYNRFQNPEHVKYGLGLKCCDGYWR